ncbi:MAG: hypothetical protein M5U34_36525 [Chloroflexi bacterium]|nr:hypothetical protein [Chloroflexota bacterium]
MMMIVPLVWRWINWGRWRCGGDRAAARARYTEALQTFQRLREPQVGVLAWHQLGMAAQGGAGVGGGGALLPGGGGNSRADSGFAIVGNNI